MTHRTILFVAALMAALPCTIWAQTVVVGPGETLTRADLDAGIFNGQPFVLGPDTTFVIAGGTFDVLSDDDTLPFDMRASPIIATTSGRIETSVLDDVAIIIDGGVDITADIANGSCELISGSILELRANASTFVMTGGEADFIDLNGLPVKSGASLVRLDGGTVNTLVFRTSKAEMICVVAFSPSTNEAELGSSYYIGISL